MEPEVCINFNLYIVPIKEVGSNLNGLKLPETEQSEKVLISPQFLSIYVVQYFFKGKSSLLGLVINSRAKQQMQLFSIDLQAGDSHQSQLMLFLQGNKYQPGKKQKRKGAIIPHSAIEFQKGNSSREVGTSKTLCCENQVTRTNCHEPPPPLLLLPFSSLPRPLFVFCICGPKLN